MIIQCQKNTLHDLTRNHRNRGKGGRCRNNGQIVVESSEKKFKCRTITNPVELMMMGYNPSKKITPMNDYDMKELMKKVG
jgi:hypothetical protein